MNNKINKKTQILAQQVYDSVLLTLHDDDNLQVFIQLQKQGMFISRWIKQHISYLIDLKLPFDSSNSKKRKVEVLFNSNSTSTSILSSKNEEEELLHQQVLQWIKIIKETTKPNALLFCTNPQLQLENYEKVIEKSMYLNLIEKKLLHFQYQHVMDVINDVNLIWLNCSIYWGKQHQFTIDANKLAKKFANVVKNSFVLKDKKLHLLQVEKRRKKNIKNKRKESSKLLMIYSNLIWKNKKNLQKT